MQSGAAKVQDCAGLASDVASVNLSQVPTQAEAEAALAKLDKRLASIRDPQVKTAATDLRARLNELLAAARTGDPTAVPQAAASARSAAGTVATACGIPLDQVLGPS